MEGRALLPWSAGRDGTGQGGSHASVRVAQSSSEGRFPDGL